jgi:hypothetical protein
MPHLVQSVVLDVSGGRQSSQEGIDIGWTCGLDAHATHDTSMLHMRPEDCMAADWLVWYASEESWLVARCSHLDPPPYSAPKSSADSELLARLCARRYGILWPRSRAWQSRAPLKMSQVRAHGSKRLNVPSHQFQQINHSVWPLF